MHDTGAADMLPPALRHLRDALRSKGYSARSVFEDRLLDELNEVDSTVDRAKATKTDLTEGLEKRSHSPGVLGPVPGSCTICGRII